MYFRTSGKLTLVMFLVVGAGAVPVRAESAEHARKSFSSLINVDALIDNYLRFVARKYNLTEEQDAFTEQLVRARVNEFLNRHYDELADLVDKLVTVRNGGEVAPEELVEWGRRIQPIYQEAKGIIVQTNDEWRGILNDEQRQMHDEDVKLMWDSFATTEDQLSRLTAGQMSVDEFRNPRRGREARSATANPPGTSTATPTARLGPAARELRTTPDDQVGAQKPTAKRAGGNGLGRATTKPSASGTTPAPADTPGTAGRRGARQHGAGAASGSTAESQWEQYVRQFIERYKLNEEQANRAHKILKSCQDLAERYRRGRAEQLEKLDRQEAALRTSDSPNKAKEQAEITAQRAKLLAPIDEIFEKQLKPRLEKIPTRAQRDAAGKGGPTDKTDKATSARPSGSKGAAAAGTPPPGPKQGQDRTTIKPGRDQPEEPPDNDQGDDEEQGDEDR